MSRPLPPSFDAILVHEELLQDEVLEAFWSGVRALPPVTLALSALCLLGFAGSAWLDRALGPSQLPSAQDSEALIAAGARSLPLIEDGELWRLLSCVFLHGDLLHLSVNVLALYALGRVCEALFGPLRVLAIFVLSGVGGSLLSHWGGVELSVGASGAVFGLLGCVLGAWIRNRRSLPRSLRGVMGRGLLPWVALNLFLGLALTPGGWVEQALGFTPFKLDHLAHVGGLITGLLMGTALRSAVLPWAPPSRLADRAMGAVVVLGVGAAWWMALSSARAALGM